MSSILVIESDHVVRTLLERTLSMGGHTVECAASLSEAAGKQPALRIDVIVLSAEGRDSQEQLQLAREAQASWDARIVMLSGRYTGSPMERHSEFTLVPKPFTREALLIAVGGSA